MNNLDIIMDLLLEQKKYENLNVIKTIEYSIKRHDGICSLNIEDIINKTVKFLSEELKRTGQNFQINILEK